MNTELIEALDALEYEKGIKKEVILEAIETALIAAYKRNYNRRWMAFNRRFRLF